MIITAVSSSFESVSKNVFTDGSEHYYLKESQIPTLSDEELRIISKFVFEDILKIQFEKENVFSYTGRLPREIVKFADIYQSLKPIEFGKMTQKYLESSTNYYYKRLKNLTMDQQSSAAVEKVVTSKISGISAPQSWIDIGIVQQHKDGWDLVCPSVAIAILQKFSENFLPFVKILVYLVYLILVEYEYER